MSLSLTSMRDGAELEFEAECFISMVSLAWANLGKSILILPIEVVFHVIFAGNMGRIAHEHKHAHTRVSHTHL